MRPGSVKPMTIWKNAMIKINKGLLQNFAAAPYKKINCSIILKGGMAVREYFPSQILSGMLSDSHLLGRTGQNNYCNGTLFYLPGRNKSLCFF